MNRPAKMRKQSATIIPMVVPKAVGWVHCSEVTVSTLDRNTAPKFMLSSNVFKHRCVLCHCQIKPKPHKMRGPRDIGWSVTFFTKCNSQLQISERIWTVSTKTALDTSSDASNPSSGLSRTIAGCKARMRVGL